MPFEDFLPEHPCDNNSSPFHAELNLATVLDLTYQAQSEENDFGPVIGGDETPARYRRYAQEISTLVTRAVSDLKLTGCPTDMGQDTRLLVAALLTAERLRTVSVGPEPEYVPLDEVLQERNRGWLLDEINKRLRPHKLRMQYNLSKGDDYQKLSILPLDDKRTSRYALMVLSLNIDGKLETNKELNIKDWMTLQKDSQLLGDALDSADLGADRSAVTDRTMRSLRERVLSIVNNSGQSRIHGGPKVLTSRQINYMVYIANTRIDRPNYSLSYRAGDLVVSRNGRQVATISLSP